MTNLCLAGLVLSPVLLHRGLAPAGTSQASAETERAWSATDQRSCEDTTLRVVSYQLSLAAAGRPDDLRAAAPDTADVDPRVAVRVTTTVGTVLSTATGELLASEDRVLSRVLARHSNEVAALCASA